MAVLLILVQVIRRLDLTSSFAIGMVRLSYICSQLAGVAFLFYIRSLIMKKGEKTEKVEVDIPPKFGELPTNPPAHQKISVMDYDLMECNKQIQQIISGMAILGLLHWWLGFIQPLFIQAIIPWKNLLLTPLVRLHFWGAQVNDDESLKRPWKVPNPFAELLGNMNQNNNGNNAASSSNISNDSNRIHEVIDEEEEKEIKNDKNTASVKAVKVGSGPKGRKED